MIGEYRIAFCIRSGYDNPLGGDGIQMLHTKVNLESYGLNIDIVTDAKELTNKYHLVHVFNYLTVNETYLFFQQSIQLNIPIVSSSIFDYSDYLLTVFLRKLYVPNYLTKKRLSWEIVVAKILGRVFGKPFFASKQFKKKICFFVENSIFVLPNSEREADLLLNYIGSDCEENRSKICVVTNGCDVTKPLYMTEDDFFSTYKIPQNYILQVGRIETRKNQLNLIYSLKDYPNIPLVFIGRVIDKNYYRKIQKIVKKRGNVYFIPYIPHSEMSNFYKYAKLHVLPSFNESTGLVSLEAIFHQCSVVMSDNRYIPVETYFPQQRQLLDPLDVDSIRSVVLKAYENPVLDDFFEKYNWRAAALQTYSVYQKILN